MYVSSRPAPTVAVLQLYCRYVPVPLEMPDVEVHIVPSRESRPVSGPGTPPIAPAIANAWSKLTGQHVFTLPFSRSAAKA